MKYIVDFIDSASADDITQYCQTNSCQILKTFNSFENVYLIESSVEPPTTDIITSIIKDDTLIVEPLLYSSNSMQTLDIQNEDEWWKTIIVKDLDMEAVSAEIPRYGIDATVYVLDSGINSNHDEFTESNIQQLYSFNSDFNDYNGHGTAIASVISGKTCGISSARLVAVKIFQAGVPTYQSHMLEALDAINTNMLLNPNKFAIVNISWAITKNEYIENKIRTLVDNYACIICSAGNNGGQIANVTPASMPEVYVIGAYDRELTICDFSNYNSAIYNTPNANNIGLRFAWAPGEYIKIAYNDGYSFAAGTSISAAIASAAAAYGSWTFLNNGEIKLWNKSRKNGFFDYAFRPADFLTIPDQYKSSTQDFAICLLTSSIGMSPSVGYQILVKSGESWDYPVLSPLYDAELISIDNLPDGITYNNGILEGYVLTDTYLVKKIEAVTRLNSGQIFTKTFYVYVTSDQYTPQTIPEQDQILDVESLRFGCCRDGANGCLAGSFCAVCYDCGVKGAPQCINWCGAPCAYQYCP